MYRQIPGYEDYAIDQSGNVKRLASGKKLKPQKHRDYLHVGLRTNGRTKVELVHRLVAKTFIGDIKDMFVDHKNFNTTDNRRRNLQICTKQQNVWKARLIKPTVSGLKGVHRVSKNCWQARIWQDYKKFDLGYYPTKELASKVYNREAKRRFGKFAVINK